MVNSNSNPKKRVPEEENKPHLFVFRIPLFWGILVRLALWYYYPTLSRMLDDRVEVTTPITSFKRRNFWIFLSL
jgi:type II secretory pathway component PulF